MTGASASSAASALLAAARGLPRVLVLDLDYTVWACWRECHSPAEEPLFYPESAGIIDACRQQHGILVAAASRTTMSAAT